MVSHHVLCPAQVEVSDGWLAWAPDCVCDLIAEAKADNDDR